MGGSDQSATGHQGARQHANLVGCIKKVMSRKKSLNRQYHSPESVKIKFNERTYSFKKTNNLN